MKYNPQCEQSGKEQGIYRYILEQKGKNTIFVIGLNPSTADESRQDPTIRKVIKFAENTGYDGFTMINLYPERETDKKNLPEKINSIAHKKNLDAINELLQHYKNPDVLVAFGNGISVRPYLKKCFIDIYTVLRDRSGKWMQIGELTAEGNPRHPLYARYAWGLNQFDAEQYIHDLNQKEKYGSI